MAITVPFMNALLRWLLNPGGQDEELKDALREAAELGTAAEKDTEYFASAEQGANAVIRDLASKTDAVTYETLTALAESASDNEKAAVKRLFEPGGEMPFKTVSDAQAVNVPKAVRHVRIGYDLYQRVASEPASDLKFRTTDRWLPDGNSDSAHGGWWQVVKPFWDATLAASNVVDIIALTIDGTPVRAPSYSINVRWCGVRGDGVTDDTAALRAAVLANPGKDIYLPKGVYKIFEDIIITANCTTFTGEAGASNGTVIDLHGVAQNGLVFRGAQHAGVRNLHIRGRNAHSGGYALIFEQSCYHCFAENVRIDYAYNGIMISGATETRLSGISLRYMLGFLGVNFIGDASRRSYRAVIDDIIADNPYPLPIAAYKTWAATTPFALGDYIFKDNRIYQCSQAGTSGSVGPTGTPGDGHSTAFTTEISDGTAKWKFVSADIAWITQDSYAYSLVVDKAALLNGGKGFVMRDLADTGSSYPIWTFGHDVECDHNLFVGIRLSRGEGFTLVNSWVGSCLIGNGIEAVAHRGEINISTTRVVGNRQHGVLIQSQPVDTLIHGCVIGDNSQGGAGVYHGITIAAEASRFQLIGNRIGDTVGTSGNPQGYGIFVSSGASDNYIISGNNVIGNLTGGVFDGGAGSSARVIDNIGYNPAGFSNVAPPGSGAVYQAGHTPETIYLSGGTVSAVKVPNDGGTTVFSATPCTLHLGPGESFSLTYSVAPTMRRQRH